MKSLLDPENTVIPRLECPSLHPTRYKYLNARNDPNKGTRLNYSFALNLQQSFEALPRLLGSMVGSHCNDGTNELLDSLQPNMERQELRCFLQQSSINPVVGGWQGFGTQPWTLHSMMCE